MSVLQHGQRVCFQSWKDSRPHAADRADRGTIEVTPTRYDVAYAVLWDTGEADPISDTGWCGLYGYRVLPLGDVPDVAPSAELVARWWDEACAEPLDSQLAARSEIP